MIACAFKRNVRLHQASQGVGQSGASWIQNREMIKPGRALRRWPSIATLPGIESNMMMINPRRNKSRFFAVTLRELKPQNPAVKIECALQVSHLQMHMPNADVGIDRFFLH